MTAEALKMHTYLCFLCIVVLFGEHMLKFESFCIVKFIPKKVGAQPDDMSSPLAGHITSASAVICFTYIVQKS